MSNHLVLCLTDDPAGNAIAATLESASYEVVSTNSAARAMALLFVNRGIDAVVLDQSKNGAWLETARLMRSIRADIAFVTVSRGRLESVPRWIDACVSAGQEEEALVPVLDTLLIPPRTAA